MNKFATTCLSFMIPLSMLSAQLIGDDSLTTTNEEQNQEVGPRIKAKFFSSDAVQAIPRLQTLDKQDPGHHKIYFKLEDFPRNKEISLSVKRLASKAPDQYSPMLNFSIQDDGSYLTQQQQRLDSIIGSSKGFLPGERVYFRFTTADGAVDKEISGIPNPAVYKDKTDTLQLRAELLSVNPTVYIIEMPNMKDNEEFDIKSVSVGETVKAKAKFSSTQPLHYSPAARGKSKGGNGFLEIHRKTGDTYRIKLPWGTALDPYLRGDKIYSPT